MDEIKGIWIPKEIWDLKELSWTERVLIAEILALSSRQECTANNEHFSNRLMVTKESASRLINKLVKLGYLKSGSVMAMSARDSPGVAGLYIEAF